MQPGYLKSILIKVWMLLESLIMRKNQPFSNLKLFIVELIEFLTYHRSLNWGSSERTVPVLTNSCRERFFNLHISGF